MNQVQLSVYPCSAVKPITINHDCYFPHCTKWNTNPRGSQLSAAFKSSMLYHVNQEKITNILEELLASILEELKEVLGIPGSLLGQP